MNQAWRPGYSPSGISLLEFVVFLPVVAVLGFWISDLLRKPVFISRFMNAVQAGNPITQAGDTMTQDFQGALPSSVRWDLMPPAMSTNTMTVSFSIPLYVNDVVQAPIPVSYSFQPTSNSTTGSLVRVLGGVTTVLATNVDPPTAANPLVQQDTSTVNVLMITLLYTPNGMPQRRMVRRVALKT